MKLGTALLVLVVSACSGEKSTPESDPVQGTAEDPGGAAKPSAPTKLPSGFAAPEARAAASSNALYIATKTELVTIKDGQFTKVAPLPNFFTVRDITLDKDGGIWILSSNSVAKLSGTAWEILKLDDGNGALKQLAVHGDDNIDVTGVYGISHYDGTAWKMAKSDDLLGKKSGGLQGLLIDGKGRGYATAYNWLLFREGKEWKSIKGDELYGAIDLADDGTLAVSTSSGVLLSTGDTWKERSIERCSGAKGVYLRGDALVLRCFDSILVTGRKGGGVKKFGTKKGEPIDVGMIEATDVDSSGRVFIGSRAGFFVLLSDGKLESWPLGSVAELASGVRAILVTGSGPEALPGKREIRFGSLAGKLSKKGKPLAKVPVEICTDTDSYLKPGETPCSSASWKSAGVTGADGSFSFAKVPVGELQFAYKPAGSAKWVLVIGFDCCTKLKEGQALDLGSIDMM